MNVEDLALGMRIQILRYTLPNIPVLSQIVFKIFAELQHLHPMPMSTNLDLVW